MKSLILLVLLPLLLLGCSTMKWSHGVPNLATVSPGIYRGGQPTAEGWQYLKDELHVTLVVKLNTDAEGSDAQSGITTIALPMPPSSFWSLLERPEASSVFQAVVAMGLSSGPVYVHCTHGQDRTGLVVGTYRLLHDEWTTQAAWNEMLDHGFHRTLLGLVSFWKNLPSK